MHTVFSHIVQKRFSRYNEDVATDALAFILRTSDAARDGMMRLLRGGVSDLPDLRFRTQQSEGNTRPDMCGFDGATPRVFVENKFWAGFTDHQPVSYLRRLAGFEEQPTVLMVVVPAAREQAAWRELVRRLDDEGVAVSDIDAAARASRCVRTGLGPALVLTTWSRLLSALELGAADDPRARNDLLQLRALCVAADSQAFVPVSAEELSDQRTPALVLQMSSAVRDAVEMAITDGVLDITGVRQGASWKRIGRYVWFTRQGGVGAWLGISFDRWQKHGGTPLWLEFSPGDFGRALEVRPLLEPWVVERGALASFEDGHVAIGLDVPAGEEKGRVVEAIVGRLREVAGVLRALDPGAEPVPDGARLDVPRELGHDARGTGEPHDQGATDRGPTL